MSESESKIRIVQLLCPSRHCILAAAYLSEDGEPNASVAITLRMMFREGIAQGALDPFCGLCRSTSIEPEDMPTVFKSMEEAKPVLDAMEKQQERFREYWKASKG